MNIRQLRILLTTAKHLNLTRAGEELRMSQPSVFQQLRLLGEEYGVKLYKNIGRGIEITAEGQEFLERAKTVLLEVEKLDHLFRKKSINDKGDSWRLRVGAVYGPAAIFLPSVLVEFKKIHPQVQFAFQTDASLEIERAVTNSQLDIGLITNPSRSTSLIYLPCRKEELVVFASPSHPLSNTGKLKLEEFVRAPLVIMRRVGYRPTRMEEHLKVTRSLENIVMFCDSPKAAKTAVMNGLGLGILYRDYVEADIRRGILKVIQVETLERFIDSFIVYRNEKPLANGVKEFVTFLHQRSQSTVSRSFRLNT
ncbi:MAG: LysR family transcriptional regulator, partial [Nitrososphaera sp.]